MSGALGDEIVSGEGPRMMGVRVERQDQGRPLLDQPNPGVTPPVNPPLMTLGLSEPPFQFQVVLRQAVDRAYEQPGHVIAGNSIARQRRPALYLYASGTTLASSMPRSWNRGIAPLFFNHAEGDRSEECSAGAIVTSGDAPGLPIEFPRALGNVLRHNSFVRNRTEGVVLSSRRSDAAQGDTSPSILGTLVEFNVVRDAPIAYHAAHGSDAVVFRRNHAYFWYPVNTSPDPPVAFQIDAPKATVAIGQNDAEDKVGGGVDATLRIKGKR